MVSFKLDASEGLEGTRRQAPNPNHVGKPSLTQRKRNTGNNMAMSRAAWATARVNSMADTFEPLCRVDADDSEAAQVLSNLVLQCTEKNESTSTTKQDTFDTPQPTDCRRSSRLLQMFKIESHLQNAPLRNKYGNPPAPQVSSL